MVPSIGDKQQRANEIGEALLGTVDSLPDDVFEDEELCYLIDEITMLCECCGWWCEPCELDEEQICEDCQ